MYKWNRSDDLMPMNMQCLNYDLQPTLCTKAFILILSWESVWQRKYKNTNSSFSKMKKQIRNRALIFFLFFFTTINYAVMCLWNPQTQTHLCDIHMDHQKKSINIQVQINNNITNSMKNYTQWYNKQNKKLLVKRSHKLRPTSHVTNCTC